MPKMQNRLLSKAHNEKLLKNSDERKLTQFGEKKKKKTCKIIT